MCNEYDVWGCILWSLTLTNWMILPEPPINHYDLDTIHLLSNRGVLYHFGYQKT